MGMSIGKGLFRVDDQVRFGKLFDRLAEHCYTLMYVPRKDLIVASLHADKLIDVKKILSEENKEIIGIVVNRKMVFLKIRWS